MIIIHTSLVASAFTTLVSAIHLRSFSRALHLPLLRQMQAHYSLLCALDIFAVNGSLQTAARTPLDLVCCIEIFPVPCTANQDSTVHFFCNKLHGLLLPHTSDSHSFQMNPFRNLRLHVLFLSEIRMISAFNSNAEWSFPIPILIDLSPRISFFFPILFYLSNIQR